MGMVWLEEPAAAWETALPIGNGSLGAMVFGSTGVEHLQLNEDSLWSGGFRDRTNPDAPSVLPKVRKLLFAGKGACAEALARKGMLCGLAHMPHYEPLGDLWIDFNDPCAPKRVHRLPDGMPYIAPDPPVVTRYARAIDLSTSVGTVRYDTGTGGLRNEFFASAPDRTIAYRVQPFEGTVSFSVSVSRRDPQSGRSCSRCEGIEATDNDGLRLWGHNGAKNGIGFELAVRVVTEGGDIATLGANVIVEGARAATVLVCGRTTFRDADPRAWCAATLDAAAAIPYDKLRQRAVGDYRALHDRFSIELAGDAALEELPTNVRLSRLRDGAFDPGLVATYVEFSRYLLISSSRVGSLPANLQGIWNADFDPMWGSKYTVNINAQMNYWLAERAGLGELHLPLLEHMRRMQRHGKDVARSMYGARGWCCHHNTDIWGDCAPSDANTAASVWPMGGAWLATHLVEHWRYVRDEDFAREFYETLRGAVEFFLDYQVLDDCGRWVTGPSTSPENFFLEGDDCTSLCMGPTMDAEILHELFGGFLEVANSLGLDETLRGEVRARLAALPPLRVGKHGQIVEWLEDYDEADPGHRHISQLYALFPGTQIRADLTPALAQAARVTLARRLSGGGGHTGWSKAWIILLYARLGMADEVWTHLSGLLGSATLDNLLDTHPPFQIDGNFGGATAVLEALVRDYGSDVRLLPATPDQLGEGSLRGLVLQCGATLDLAWANGQVTSAVLHGQREGSVQVTLPNDAQLRAKFATGNTVRLI